MSTFDGIPAAAAEFYGELEQNNTRDWWHAHSDVYAVSVKEPLAALLERLEPRFGPGKIFRPNRDIRFSQDKSPYKTAIGAILDQGGYVQFSADGLAAGCGM